VEYHLEWDWRYGMVLSPCSVCLSSVDNEMQAPEGPHIYRKDGWYYLLAAEGEPVQNRTCCAHI
jgi:beta-xylosidase